MTLINEYLSLANVLLLLGIVGIVGAYRPDEQTRKRRLVSIGAAVFAGTCLASAMYTVTQWGLSCQAPNPWQTLFTGCVFVAVAYTRGNVAKLLPRLKWTNRI